MGAHLTQVYKHLCSRAEVFLDIRRACLLHSGGPHMCMRTASHYCLHLCLVSSSIALLLQATRITVGLVCCVL